jgi:hypothetical protein
VVAKTLGAAVFILYYGMLALDITLLVHPENLEVGRRIMGVAPPVRDGPGLVAAWLMLHFQHLVCPLFLWLEEGVGVGAPRETEGDPVPPPQPCNPRIAIQDILVAYLAYVAWNGVCWSVQGRPAYPIQEKVRNMGYYGVGVFLFGLFLAHLAVLACVF